MHSSLFSLWASSKNKLFLRIHPPRIGHLLSQYHISKHHPHNGSIYEFQISNLIVDRLTFTFVSTLAIGFRWMGSSGELKFTLLGLGCAGWVGLVGRLFGCIPGMVHYPVPTPTSTVCVSKLTCCS